MGDGKKICQTMERGTIDTVVSNSLSERILNTSVGDATDSRVKGSGN